MKYIHILIILLVYVFNHCLCQTTINQQHTHDVNSTSNFPDDDSIHGNISPHVTCTIDVITVTVPRMSIAVASISPNYVMFRGDSADDHCRAIETDSATLQLTINLKSNQDCGSTLKKVGPENEELLLYGNEIVYLDVNRAKIVSLLNFTCLFSDEYNVPVVPPSYRHGTFSTTPGVSVGIEMQLKLYRDESYSDESLLDEDFPTIYVGQFLFVQIATSGTRELISGNKIVVEQCFASLYPQDGNLKAVHRFVNNGCPDAHDPTVEILSYSDSSMIRFKFQMFKWLRVTVQKIYLFCRVSSCVEPPLFNEEMCNYGQKNCSSLPLDARGRQGYNESIDTEEASGAWIDKPIPTYKNSIVLETGPIFPSKRPKDKPNSKPKDVKNIETLTENNPVDQKAVHIAVGVVCGVCFLIFSSAGYALWRRHVARRKKQGPAPAPMKEERIQPGFAFVLRSSDDADVFGESAVKENATKRESHQVKRVRSCRENEHYPFAVENGKKRSRSAKRSHSFQIPCESTSRRNSEVYVEKQRKRNI